MKLQIKNLQMEFKDTTVLRNIDYTFEQGTIYALLGRNGAGKTTFFNCLSGSLKPQSMEACLEVNGEMTPLSIDDIGYIEATPSVPLFLTAREYLTFMNELHQPTNTKQEMHRLVEEQFVMLDIEEEAKDRLLKDYSHGMKSKIQMFVHLIAKPKVLFLDEPLTALDVVMIEKMKDMIRSFKHEYIIIFSTHSMDIAVDLCDEVVLLHEGVLEGLTFTDLKKDTIREDIIRKLSEDAYEK